MKKIGIVCGGFSSEFDVSVKSAHNILKHFPDAYDAYLIYLKKEGWFIEINGIQSPLNPVDFSFNDGSHKIDAAIVYIHGDPGENGKIQAYLAAGKPIVASLNGIGAQTITHAQAGMAVPAEDGLALSKAIVSLSELNVNELAAMGTNGHEYYMREFDSKLRNHNLIQLFQEMGA